MQSLHQIESKPTDFSILSHKIVDFVNSTIFECLSGGHSLLLWGIYPDFGFLREVVSVH